MKTYQISAAFTVLFAAFAIQAEVVKDLCIKKIDEILKHLPQAGRTVAVFDWDKTISSDEGKYDLRELDEKSGTLPVINALHAQGIKTIVQTARFAGASRAGNLGSTEHEFIPKLQKTVTSMLETLKPTDWKNHGALLNDDLAEYKITLELPSLNERPYMLTLNQIVFAGGTYGKGASLAYLIDQNKFKDKINNIIFIDNSSKIVKEVRGTFKNRPENVYLFHYPKPTYERSRDENSGDEPCE